MIKKKKEKCLNLVKLQLVLDLLKNLKIYIMEKILWKKLMMKKKILIIIF